MSDLNNFRKIIHQKFREDFSKNILSLRKKIFEQNAYVEQYLYEQDDQLTATNEPLNQDEIQESFKNFFTSLSKIIKFKIKVPQTTELKNAKNITIQSINDIVKSAIDNKINANSFIDLVKKKFETTFDAIRNESQHIFDDLQKKQQEQQKNQQQNQTNQQQNQTNQQQNQTNQQQNQTTVESYRKLSQNKKVLQERDDPITVNSLKNILKLTPQDKIADIISKFSKEEFEQFIDGLQKASLDTIAKALEKNTGNQESDQNKQQNQEESDQGEQTENQGQTQETPTTQEGGEGNLKLAEL